MNVIFYDINKQKIIDDFDLDSVPQVGDEVALAIENKSDMSIDNSDKLYVVKNRKYSITTIIGNAFTVQKSVIVDLEEK